MQVQTGAEIRRLHAHVLRPDWRLVATLNIGHRFITAKLDGERNWG